MTDKYEPTESKTLNGVVFISSNVKLSLFKRQKKLFVSRSFLSRKMNPIKKVEILSFHNRQK